MDQLVEFERVGVNNAIGIVRLVRERPLNSLLLDTINQLSDQIYAWLADDSIACIFFDSSSERAFCAGADITALYHAIKEADSGDNDYANQFFLHEYRLNYALHITTKPIVVWGNGIVMGGGLGLMGGCSHRLVTETTKVAMPEITIGLFPDAGGTWFLSQAGELGLFAGLTGCQITAGDALAMNLADLYVESDAKTRILEVMGDVQWQKLDSDNHGLIDACLADFKLAEAAPEALLNHKASIQDLMQRVAASDSPLDTFNQGLDALPEDPWLSQAVDTYRAGSPTTAHIFVEQMQRAKSQSLAEMFQMELVIAYQCMRHVDFSEGVRALMVDKDRSPRWRYDSTTEVPRDYVLEHFEPSWSGAHPLADLGL